MHDSGKLPALNQLVLAERQLIKSADHKPMARVKVRQPMIAADVVAVLQRDSLRALRAVVRRLRKGVRSVELKTFRQALSGGYPECIVVRNARSLALGNVQQGDAGGDWATSGKGREWPRRHQRCIQKCLVQISRLPQVRPL